MVKLVDWIKANKLTSVLLVIVAYFVVTSTFGNFFGVNLSRLSYNSADSVRYAGGAMGKSISSLSMPATYETDIEEMAPAPPSPVDTQVAPSESVNRMVIRDTNLSMVVNDVGGIIRDIENLAAQYGGFLVDSNLNVPEGASSGTITVRVKASERAAALDAIKKLGVRVVSESVSGRDVTDQYEDIGAKLDVLNRTKAKFEEIMDQAVEIQDLLQVQRELVSLQSQIDNLKGRQEFLKKSADLTKITVYLSTDELALPYAPDTAWRPAVVFKQAVRSLITTVRGLGNRLIWLAVYSVIWLPLLIGFVLIRKFLTRKKPAKLA